MIGNGGNHPREAIKNCSLMLFWVVLRPFLLSMGALPHRFI
jgi:hypothetical protein